MDRAPVECRVPGVSGDEADTETQIDRDLVRMPSQDVTLVDEGGENAGEPAVPAGVGHHACQPGMERQRGHGLAERGHPPVAVERPERAQQPVRLVHRPPRWRIEPAELGRVVHPPGGELEGGGGEIDLGDLRLDVRAACPVLEAGPEAHRHPGLGPSGTSRALLRRRP